MIRIGCCGFAASRREYYARLELVEVQQTFYQPPRVATAERWRAEAPAGFEFTVKAWQLITHEPSSPTYRRLSKPVPPDRRDRYGFFRDTEEVWSAWEATRAIAAALAAKVILFQTPASFTPSREHKERLRAFMRKIPRDGRLIAFEPRGVWEPEEAAALCADLDLVPAVDPLRTEPPAGRVAYFRLHGPVTGRYRYDDGDLHSIAAKCEGRDEAYCLFNHPEMWRDALRFRDLVAGLALP